jgi:hypothetical protein
VSEDDKELPAMAGDKAIIIRVPVVEDCLQSVVGRCRLTVSKPVLKAPVVSASLLVATT